jgi:hypothetical protein
MNWMTFVPAARTAIAAGREGPVLDYRQRREIERREREELKRVEQEGQCSDLNTAGARICAWEKVHHLRMPADATHPVLRQIAAATHLAYADVLAEQRLRAEQRAHHVTSE